MLDLALCLPLFSIRPDFFTVPCCAISLVASISISVVDRLVNAILVWFIARIAVKCTFLVRFRLGCGALLIRRLLTICGVTRQERCLSLKGIESCIVQVVPSPSTSIFVSLSAVGLGFEASSSSLADSRSFRAFSTGPNTLAFRFLLLALFLFERRLFAI